MVPHSAQLLDYPWELPLFIQQKCCSSRGVVSLTMLGWVDTADKACRQRKCREHSLSPFPLAKSDSPERSAADKVSLCESTFKSSKPPWEGVGYRRLETHTNAQLLSKLGY